MGRMGSAWSTPAVVEGAVSVLVAFTLAAVAVAATGEHRAGLAWLGGAALAVLVGGIIFASPIAVWLTIAALGLAGVIATAPGAPLYAVGLFVTAETALWSADDRFRLTEEIGLRRDRLALLAVIGASGVAVGATLRLLARDPGERSSRYSVIAGVSVIALAALIAIGVRRQATNQP